LSVTIEDVDLEFQNTIVKIVALSNLQELRIVDTTVGPLEEGKEYEMRFWIASELVEAGYARFSDDISMALSSLTQIHWRETRLQTGQRISPLPAFFYPKLRHYLNELKQKTVSDPSMAETYRQAARLAQDVVSCRLKKIVNLAPHARAESLVQSLSDEERTLFMTIRAMVSEWQSRILHVEGSK
jgi:hypothetical protein